VNLLEKLFLFIEKQIVNGLKEDKKKQRRCCSWKVIKNGKHINKSKPKCKFVGKPITIKHIKKNLVVLLELFENLEEENFVVN